MHKLLMIDDDIALTDMLKEYLSEHSLDVSVENDPIAGIEVLRSHHYDVLLLDVMMPELDGFEVLRQIRQFSSIPVIMLTAKGDDFDRILGLELGADDYIIKPFDPAEVVARIRARLRQDRTGAHTGTSAYFSTWVAHFDRYSLEDENGLETPFSHAESEVLRMFLQSPKRLISRAQMQETLGSGASESFDRAMDVRISRLRTKLREDPKNPQLIKTIYGAGYIFLSDVRWVTQSPKPA